MIIKEPNYDKEIARLNTLLETDKVKSDQQLFKKTKNILSGLYCEKQMSYVLKIQFEANKDILVFNDLKLEIDGRSAQIDHVVLTCYSAYFIESKSVRGEITVNEFGEWVRKWYDSKFKKYCTAPMDSPLEQSKRHELVWCDIMRNNADMFMGKLLLGIKKGMGSYNYEHYIAISKDGKISGEGRADLKDSLCKYDQVPGKIMEHHTINAKGMLGTFMSKSDETFKTLNESELEKLGEYLLGRNKSSGDIVKDFNLPRIEDFGASPKKTQVVIEVIPEEDLKWTEEKSIESVSATFPQAEIITTSAEKSQCPECSGQMSVQSGRYGYYWKCGTCSKNVAIKEPCPSCTTKMRIRKAKHQFFLGCKSCDTEELYHQA